VLFSLQMSLFDCVYSKSNIYLDHCGIENMSLESGQEIVAFYFILFFLVINY